MRFYTRIPVAGRMTAFTASHALCPLQIAYGDRRPSLRFYSRRISNNCFRATVFHSIPHWGPPHAGFAVVARPTQYTQKARAARRRFAASGGPGERKRKAGRKPKYLLSFLIDKSHLERQSIAKLYRMIYNGSPCRGKNLILLFTYGA